MTEVRYPPRFSPSGFPLLHDTPEPVQSGDPNAWRIPVLGLRIIRSWSCYYIPPEPTREELLVRQASERGPVPESEWEPYEYVASIRESLTKIVLGPSLHNKLTLHPLDPFELTICLDGEWAELTLTEIELDFDVPANAIVGLVISDKTFLDVIHWIEAASAKKLE